jgi:hypothetical protein
VNTRTERIDRTISSIIGGLENLTVKLPAARAHLIAQIRITGEPASTPTDATTVTHTSELTPVEAAANNRAHLQAILDDWSATLDAIALQVTLEQYAATYGNKAAMWQAGHTKDGDIGGQLLPEHARCNAQAGAIARNKPPTSEDW